MVRIATMDSIWECTLIPNTCVQLIAGFACAACLTVEMMPGPIKIAIASSQPVSSAVDEAVPAL
jgi:hypothetical protein